MTELDQAIAAAFASEGKQEDVNKVYLMLLQSMLFVPVKKEESTDPEEPFTPLFAKIDDNYYMVVFDTEERLFAWVGENQDQVGYVEISGRDVIAGISEQVYLCLNMGSQYYKEFSPDEVKRLKMIVSRIDQLKQPE
jgi:hypothetical protein